MSIDVFRDHLGIPHVRAGTTTDAFFGQGYVHAEDRMWQMDLDRRKGAGRASEYLGATAVTLDAFLRRMALDRAAKADYDALDDESRSVLDAYAAGVNAGAKPSKEHDLLQATLDPWQPWDCATVFKVRHVFMNSYDLKLWRQHAPDVLATTHGREDLLIVPVGARETFDATFGDDDGSNSWAVHGSRTASGLPLVAGDPHRALEVPNVYYQNHIACPEFDAIGFSIPGVPGIFHFGHNADVAWCITHAMADTMDLFVDDTPTGRRRERIEVRGSDPVDIDVVETASGPVVFGENISLRWRGLHTDTLRCLLPILRARTVDEMDEAMRDWADPCNSLVMADRQGHIAYLHRGKVPIRDRANHWTPVPATHTWRGDVPFEELPRLRDPDEGIIVTANNRVVGSSYPYVLGVDYGPPYRAERILERLRSIDDATAGDMASIHADRWSLGAVPFIERARTLLGGWDGTMDPADDTPTVYAMLRERLAELVAARMTLPDPHPDDPSPIDPRVRVRTALARLELTEQELQDAIAYAAGFSGTRWGDVHRTRIVHPLDERFNPPSVAVGGDRDTVQVAGTSKLGTDALHSSVCRYVFDLADWENSAWVVPLGASGDPGSAHFADQQQAWADVRLYPMTYDWSRIEREQHYVIAST